MKRNVVKLKNLDNFQSFRGIVGFYSWVWTVFSLSSCLSQSVWMKSSCELLTSSLSTDVCSLRCYMLPLAPALWWAAPDSPTHTSFSSCFRSPFADYTSAFYNKVPTSAPNISEEESLNFATVTRGFLVQTNALPGWGLNLAELGRSGGTKGHQFQNFRDFSVVLNYRALLYMNASAQGLWMVDSFHHASLRFITDSWVSTHCCQLFFATWRIRHWCTL